MYVGIGDLIWRLFMCLTKCIFGGALYPTIVTGSDLIFDRPKKPFFEGKVKHVRTQLNSTYTGT